MKISLSGKLTLAFLLVALTATFLVALVMRLYSPEQLNRLVIDQQRSELSELLEEYYLANGSFRGIGEIIRREQVESGTQPDTPKIFNPPSSKRKDFNAFRADKRANLFGIANPHGLVKYRIKLMPTPTNR